MKYALLFINNDPSRISETIFGDVVQANILQQVDLADAYGLETARVYIQAPASDPVAPSNDKATIIPVYFRPSTADDPSGAVAFHYVNPDTERPECHILTDVVTDLPGPGNFTDKLATAASHECCETREDVYADDWADLPDGRQEAVEVCDRTQGDTYSKKVASGRDVQVSNFLFPAAFSNDPLPTGTKVDFMDLLSSEDPRAIRPGGYAAIRNKDGNVVQVLGDRRAAVAYSHHSMVKLGVDVQAMRDEWADAPTPVKMVKPLTRDWMIDFYPLSDDGTMTVEHGVNGFTPEVVAVVGVKLVSVRSDDGEAIPFELRNLTQDGETDRYVLLNKARAAKSVTIDFIKTASAASVAVFGKMGDA